MAIINKIKEKILRCEYEFTIPHFFEEMLVKQDFWIRGELVIVEDVPAAVCPQCGEKIAKAPRVSVPTIKFEKTFIT